MTRTTEYHRRSALRRAPVLAASVAVLFLSLAGTTPAGPDGLRAAVCGTWVLQESSTVAELQSRRPQLTTALLLPGVTGFSLRFRWTALEDVPGAEAAQRLGMNVAAVYKAKSRILKMLQEEVRRMEEGEQP